MRIFVFVVASQLLVTACCAEELNGVVVQENGNLVAGAAVNVAVIHHSPPLRFKTVTNERGRFQIDLPKLEKPMRLAFAVRWKKKGAQIVQKLEPIQEPAKRPGKGLQSITIRLKDCGVLHGRLLGEEDGTPIGRAQVYLDTGEVLVTDEKGEFLVSGLPMGKHSLIPVAPGRVRNYVNFDTANCPDAELELRLQRATSLAGRITDENGKPIPNAYLTRSSSGTALTLNGWDQACQADGTFVYDGISSNRLFHGLEARAPGYHSVQLSSYVRKNHESSDIDIRLKKKQTDARKTKAIDDGVSNKPRESVATLPRKSVRAIVQDDQGKFVAGADVRWADFPWDQTVKSVSTNGLGEFVLEEVPNGPGAILVIAEGFAPKFVSLNQNNDADDVFGLGMRITLDRGTEVQGIVRGPNGKPVPGAKIVPVTYRSDTAFANGIWLTERSAITDENGEFKISALSNQWRFDVLKDGYDSKRSMTLKYDGLVNEIELRSSGAIAGTIFDENEKRVRNFNVRIRIPRERNPDEKFGGYFAGFDWYGVSFTRADGAFICTGVKSDHWMRLIVRAPGIGFAIQDRVKSTSLNQLPRQTDAIFQLKRFKPLTVRAIDKDTKQPLPNATVMLLEDEPDFSHGFSWGYDELKSNRARTDNLGGAVFQEPACVDGTLAILVPGYARKRIGWTDGSDTVTFELEVASSLSGIVKFRDRAVKVGGIRLSNGNDHYFADLAPLGGSFKFEQLPAGVYDFSVTDSNGMVHYSDQIAIEPKEHKKIEVKIPESADSDAFG